ncbi:MAG: neutral/alkaline non-lysosomal ceramidase N-terminal domain-containing protein [Candidatus Schekmanbacteria bacterium]|nr:neutral/alkaline non-lysosomal ceramidase N-terminal domain-containing protein [Candidatus Schekmanbacteria bacterium]
MSSVERGSWCGAAEVDITPPPGLPLAGYGALGRIAKRTIDPLKARAVYFRDSRGHDAALCVVDLASASGYLFRRAAEMASASCGLVERNLVVAGTHTHAAPGNFFASSYFDSLTQARRGFDRGLAEWLATRIAAAVTMAAANARPAALGLATGRLWGVSTNACPGAFHRNPDAPAWEAPGGPASGAPPSTPPGQRATDPRVKVLAAFAEGGAPLAVLASFACHNTCLGPAVDGYSADWTGAAAGMLSARLGAGCLCAVMPGTAGDVNMLVPGATQGTDLARGVGRAVADTVGAVLDEARRGAAAYTVDCRLASIPLTSRLVDGDPATELAETWCVGRAALGGAPDGRSLLYHLGLAGAAASARYFSPAHPQFPKSPALGPVQAALRRLLALSPPRCWPLHLWRVGPALIATVPGEPTVMAAWRIERALARADPGAVPWIIGYAGEYAGYFTTPEEYLEQQYEAASMLYGRYCTNHVQARLLALQATPVAGGEASGAPPAWPRHRAVRRFARLKTRAGAKTPE